MEKFKKEIPVQNQTEFFQKVFPLGDGSFFEAHYDKDNLIKEYFIRDDNGQIIEFADIKADENFYKRVKEIFTERGTILKDEELKKITLRYIDESQRNALEEINYQKNKEN